MRSIVAGALTCIVVEPSIAQEQMNINSMCIVCDAGGFFRGQAQNGTIINQEFSGGEMCVDTVSHGDQNGPYINFTRNGQPWPSRPWGVRADSWNLTCAE